MRCTQVQAWMLKTFWSEGLTWLLRLWSDITQLNADPGLEVKWPLVMHICSCRVSSTHGAVTTAAKAQSPMELDSETMQNGRGNWVIWWDLLGLPGCVNDGRSKKQCVRSTFASTQKDMIMTQGARSHWRAVESKGEDLTILQIAE